MENVLLKSFTTYEEDGLYFAHVVYRYEDDRGLWELTVPKACIPVEPYRFDLKLDPDGGHLELRIREVSYASSRHECLRQKSSHRRKNPRDDRRRD